MTCWWLHSPRNFSTDESLLAHRDETKKKTEKPSYTQTFHAHVDVECVSLWIDRLEKIPPDLSSSAKIICFWFKPFVRQNTLSRVFVQVNRSTPDFYSWPSHTHTTHSLTSLDQLNSNDFTELNDSNGAFDLTLCRHVCLSRCLDRKLRRFQSLFFTMFFLCVSKCVVIFLRWCGNTRPSTVSSIECVSQNWISPESELIPYNVEFSTYFAHICGDLLCRVAPNDIRMSASADFLRAQHRIELALSTFLYKHPVYKYRI